MLQCHFCPSSKQGGGLEEHWRVMSAGPHWVLVRAGCWSQDEMSERMGVWPEHPDDWTQEAYSRGNIKGLRELAEKEVGAPCKYTSPPHSSFLPACPMYPVSFSFLEAHALAQFSSFFPALALLCGTCFV